MYCFTLISLKFMTYDIFFLDFWNTHIPKYVSIICSVNVMLFVCIRFQGWPRDYYRKSPSIKIQRTNDSVVSCPNWSVYNTNPVPKSQGILQKRIRKILRARETGSVPWDGVSKTCLGSYAHEASITWLPKQDLNKDDSSRCATWEEGNNKCPALNLELQDTKECWEMEKIIIPREEPSQFAIQDQVVSPLGSLFKNESPLLTGYIQWCKNSVFDLKPQGLAQCLRNQP